LVLTQSRCAITFHISEYVLFLVNCSAIQTRLLRYGRRRNNLSLGNIMGHLLAALALIFGFTFLQTHGGNVVEKLTGRGRKPASSNRYAAVYFGLAILIAIPPIYLLPGAHYLVLVAIGMVGTLAGSFVAQGLYGLRT